MIIRIYFVDFAAGLDLYNNWFTNFLSKYFEIEISENPDFLIYSSFGHKHLTYSCTKIFFTGENDRPNFFLCDYALGYDLRKSTRYLRLPLYVIWKGLDYRKLLFPDYTSIISHNPKSKFCCFLISNPKALTRNKFFNKLNSIRRVDSGGKALNNIGREVSNKMEFISPYKFMIAYENTSYPGYVTEKIFECFFTNTIPIYWGSNCVERDFNSNRIIDRKSFKSDEDMISYVLYLDQDNEAYQRFIKQPIFVDNLSTIFFDENRVYQFFATIFAGSFQTKSIGFRKKIGILIRKKRNFVKKVFKTDFL